MPHCLLKKKLIEDEYYAENRNAGREKLLTASTSAMALGKHFGSGSDTDSVVSVPTVPAPEKMARF